VTRPRVQSLIRRGGERLAESAPQRAVLAALPAAVTRQFDPEAAVGLEATFELRVRDPGGSDPARFAIRIAGGQCAVVPGPAPEAGAAVTIGADDLIRLASHAASWPALLSSGRMELAGDPFLGLRFPALFGLPASVRI
jgi:hypothetical protein